jgi:hypothetical protein
MCYGNELQILKHIGSKSQTSTIGFPTSGIDE